MIPPTRDILSIRDILPSRDILSIRDILPTRDILSIRDILSSRDTWLPIRAVATVGCGGGGVTPPPQASSLSAKLLRIKVLSAIFRKSILSQEDDS